MARFTTPPERTPVGLVNRSVLLVRPTAEFAKWLAKAIDPQTAEQAVNDARRDPTAYLVPEVEDADDLDAMLGESWPIVFENELAIWVEEEARWPAERTEEMFRQWFDVDRSTMVLDLCEWELSQDEVGEGDHDHGEEE